jgi:hypothetical protein
MDELVAEYSQGIHLNKMKSMIENIVIEFDIHFHEEEMLYKKYKEKTTILMTIERLQSEHKLILQKMSEESKKIRERRANFENVRKFFQMHEHLEEYDLYPELARAISDEEQESVMQDILEKEETES